MDPAGVVLGTTLGPFPGCVTADLVKAYAIATNDPDARVRAGALVPPVAVVTQIWAAQEHAFSELIPPVVHRTMTGGVHGQHELLLHRPLVPGEELQTWVEGQGSRRGGRHDVVTLHYRTLDAAGEPVVEQWWTTVFFDAAGEPVGTTAPDHPFPEAARAELVGEHRVVVDPDMPRRYAEVSGDWSRHHFDDDVARGSGFERRFVHGLCTMALCGQAVTELAAGGDPSAVSRLAVRFAAPAYVGDEVVVRLYRHGATNYVFEARTGDTLVIRNGLAELRR
jgi:acyl dehydratase